MSNDHDVGDFQTFLHDLAKPMTLIRLYLENLVRLEKGELVSPSPNFRLELIEKILSASDEMVAVHAQQRTKLGRGKKPE